MNFRLVQIILWAAVALVGGYFLLGGQGEAPQSPEVETAQTFSVANPYIGLTGTDGAPVNTKDFKDQHQLLYFGFTYCPDVCPIGVRKMVTADALYQLDGGTVPLKTLFASFDVARDTAEVLSAYETNLSEGITSEFEPGERAAIDLNLIALTGDDTAMDKALEAYPVFVNQITDPDQPDGYTYSHTDIIYWVQPGGTVKFLSARYSARDIADMLKAWS
ncbi:MAG: SCO family protein [Pseudomonadota bacterium]